jgi:hypothetical protein
VGKSRIDMLIEFGIFLFDMVRGPLRFRRDGAYWIILEHLIIVLEFFMAGKRDSRYSYVESTLYMLEMPTFTVNGT